MNRRTRHATVWGMGMRAANYVMHADLASLVKAFGSASKASGNATNWPAKVSLPSAVGEALSARLPGGAVNPYGVAANDAKRALWWLGNGQADSEIGMARRMLREAVEGIEGGWRKGEIDGAHVQGRLDSATMLLNKSIFG